MTQISLFDGENPLKLGKIRLIEMFAGYGSQALSLKYIGIPFEHWAICEWAVKSIQAYKDMHFADDNTDYPASYTDDELVDVLFKKGISSNYSEPMTKEQNQYLRQDGCVGTLTTDGSSPKHNNRVVEPNLKTKMCNELIASGAFKENDVIRHSYTNSRMNGEMKDIQQNNISPTLDTRCDCLGVVNNYRIRKLTPRECFRLMGVHDEDFDRVARHQSNSSLYHLAGDSIVTNVLMAIFKQME